MATHNPKESRPTCESTLSYMYRGDNHEHKVGAVIHLGGNLLSGDPVHRIESEVVIDLEEIIAEFNFQAGLHKGKGEDLFKHYVISLAPDEKLEDYQWLEMITAYMQAQGFDNSTKWTAVEHRDTNSCHVHILACRVKGDKYGSLVSTYNDYEKGWSVMRTFEKKFGLQQLENPEDSFGSNKSKRQIKSQHRRGEQSPADEAVAIRGAFKKLYSEFGKPKNMRELVLGLAKCGVSVKISTNESGEIKGINYMLKEGKGNWIPGSKVKATRFTWQALQKKEGISYDPYRDDPFLHRVDGVVEIHIQSSKIFDYYSFKSSVLELEERRLLLSRFRVQESMDIEALMAIVSAIIILICRLLGFRVSIDDCEFSVGNAIDNSTNAEMRTINQPQIDSLNTFSVTDSKVLDISEYWINSRLLGDGATYLENSLALNQRLSASDFNWSRFG